MTIMHLHTHLKPKPQSCLSYHIHRNLLLDTSNKVMIDVRPVKIKSFWKIFMEVKSLIIIKLISIIIYNSLITRRLLANL